MTKRGYDVLLVDFEGVLRHWPADDVAIERDCGRPDGAIRAVAFAPDLIRPAITGTLSDDGAGGSRNAWRSGIPVRVRNRPPGVGDECDVPARSRSPRARPGRLLRRGREFQRDRSAKPDRRIYHRAITLAGSTVERVLYVDDSHDNVEAAIAAGIRGHRFDGVAALVDFLEHNEALSSRATTTGRA